MNEYYVYAHKRLDNNTIFYVGKGKGDRAYIKSNRSEYWKRIVSKCDYEVLFLDKNLCEEDAYKLEIIHIATLKQKGFCEANFTDGGDGVNVKIRWWNDKISKALIGTKRPAGNQSKAYKDFADKQTLIDLYKTQKKSSVEISKLLNISYATVCSRLKDFGIELRNSGKENKKVKCVEDGIVFNSISEAANHYNLFRENIRKVLAKKYKHTGKKTFIYI